MESSARPSGIQICVFAVIALVSAMELSGCHTSSKAPPVTAEAPLSGAARSVTKEWIEFRAIGEDRFSERARFLAEHSALEDVANECSFIPDGTTHQVFDGTTILETSSSYLPSTEQRRASALARVPRAKCEAAKIAIQPDAIKKLANTELMAKLHDYQETVGEVTTPSAKTIIEKATNIDNEAKLIQVRQQILYAKQAIAAGRIPAPKPMGALDMAVKAVARYEAAHPELVESKQSWSVGQTRSSESVAEPVLSQEAKRPTPAKSRNGLPPKSFPKR